jgi:hypothetical protein
MERELQANHDTSFGAHALTLENVQRVAQCPRRCAALLFPAHSPLAEGLVGRPKRAVASQCESSVNTGGSGVATRSGMDPRKRFAV